MEYPKLNKIRQKFEKSNFWAGLKTSIVDELKKLSHKTKPGQSIAVCVGSRGIDQIDNVVQVVCEYFRQLELRVVIVPAMGSHGGGTEEGQLDILKLLGISSIHPDYITNSDMESTYLGMYNEFPIYFSKVAQAQDHIFLINRIKPHTMLEGKYQSGLVKMLTVGLGKHQGAQEYHRMFQKYNSDDVLYTCADVIMERCNVLGGLALIENQLGELHYVKSVSGRKLLETEPELLKSAERYVAKLPFKEIDILIVDEIGKDISGCGMDPTVIGRKYNNHKHTSKDTGPNIRFIGVRSLSEKTNGNALGIGLAEFCHKNVGYSIDYESTITNAIASGEPSSAMMPLRYGSDKAMLHEMLNIVGKPVNEVKLVRIKNTRDLYEMYCSEASFNELTRFQAGAIPLSFNNDIMFDKKGDFA